MRAVGKYERRPDNEHPIRGVQRAFDIHGTNRSFVLPLFTFFIQGELPYGCLMQVGRNKVIDLFASFHEAQRWSSAAAGEERSDETDVGCNDVFGGAIDCTTHSL